MCIGGSVPKPPPAPPPPPALPEDTAKKIEDTPGAQEARRLASRLGTNQLVIPFQNVNVPQ